MKVHRPRTPSPRSPEYDYDEYDAPYLSHGNVGWNDHLEPRKRAHRVPERQFPFGFGIHASHCDE